MPTQAGKISYLLSEKVVLPPQVAVVLVVERQAFADGLERGLGGTLEVGKVFLVVPDGLDVGFVLGGVLLVLHGDALKGVDHLVKRLVPLLLGHVHAGSALAVFLEDHQAG